MCSLLRIFMVLGCAWSLQGSFSERGQGNLYEVPLSTFSSQWMARNSSLCAATGREYTLSCLDGSLAAEGGEGGQKCGCALIQWAAHPKILNPTVLPGLPLSTDARKAACASLMCPAAGRLLEMYFYSCRYLYRNIHFLLLTLGRWCKAWLGHAASLYIGVKWRPQGSAATATGQILAFCRYFAWKRACGRDKTCESQGNELQERLSEHTRCAEEMALLLLSCHRSRTCHSHPWEIPRVEQAGIYPLVIFIRLPLLTCGKCFRYSCEYLCLRYSTPKAVCTRAVGFFLCTAARNLFHSFLNHRAGLFAEQQGLKYKSGRVLNRLMFLKFVMLVDIRRLVWDKIFWSSERFNVILCLSC